MRRGPLMPAYLTLAALLCTTSFAFADTSSQVSLSDIAPPEAIMVVTSQRNEQDAALRQHLQAVYQAFQQEQIAERVVEIIQQRMEEDDLEQVELGYQRFQEAIAPASLQALMDAEETCYYQVSDGKMAQQVVAVRMTDQAVQGFLQAARNLIELAEEVGDDKVAFEEAPLGDAVSISVILPEGTPVQPTLIGKGDTLLFSTTQQLAQQAAEALEQGLKVSKFDDERVTSVLSKLPKAESSLMIYDGKLQMASLDDQLAPVIDVLEKKAEDDPEAATVLRIVQAALKEVDVNDLQAMVGYMQQGNLHSETLTTLLPGTEDRLLRKVLDGGAPFERWNRWVPASAINYRLNSGFNILGVYHQVLDLFSREAPEMAAEALAKLEQYQQQFDLDLEQDLLGLFSGETVSVTLAQGQSVSAFACTDPAHTREMLERLLQLAMQFPQVQQQQLELVPSADLEGFEELRANVLAMFGVRPVIGFKDGWLIIGSTPDAAQAVLDVRWGDAADVTSSADFQRFGVSLNGPLSSISYANTAENIRQGSRLINQVAAMAPLFLGPAMAEAKPQDARTMQQVLGLLPRIARVIEKFDFLEATLTYSQPSAPNTASKSSITLIRQD